MPWNALAIVGLLSLWAACGLLPWCVALFARRGAGAFTSLPLAIVAGIAGGLLVAAIAKDGIAFAVSMPVAMVAGAAVSTLPLWRRIKELWANA